MKALLNSDSTTISPINPQNFTQPKTQTSLHFSLKDNHHHCLIRQKARFTAKSVIDSAMIDQLGIPESDFRNPAVSTSYRSSKFRKPNQTVLEAQAKVCTGPTQTRPLTKEQAFKVFDTILRSDKHTVCMFLLINVMGYLQCGMPNNVGDLEKQPFYRFLQRTYVVHPIALAVLLYAMRGLPFIVWGMME